MLQHFFSSHERIEALRRGPTGSLLERFAEKLRHAGYAKITARRHIRAAEHLLHWAERKGVPISDLTESSLKLANPISSNTQSNVIRTVPCSPPPAASTL